MSADPNKKSARTFQARDVLWETFEQLARELECSVDYLINEAMKHYARQRAQGGTRTPYPGGREASQPQATQVAAPAALKPPAAPARAPVAAAPAPAPLPLPPTRVPPPGRPPTSSIPLPPPRTAPAGPSTRPPVAPPPIPATAPVVPPPIPGTRSVPPPVTSPGVATRSASMPPRGPARDVSANGFPAPSAHASSLTLVYNGDRYPITKERFVIGRGKQSSDLTLKDPNVSRQHALVELQNGQYFMVDMGSTNGVAFNGQRIARKPIAEGDVFRICDHDLLFTYS
jgi:hypothetical protein